MTAPETLSRRRFLTGVGGLGAGVLTAGVLGTATASPAVADDFLRGLGGHPVVHVMTGSPRFASLPQSSRSFVAPGYTGGAVIGEDGIPRTTIKTVTGLVVHPTRVGNFITAHLDAYGHDHDRAHLQMAGNALAGLHDHASEVYDNAYFAHYDFVWAGAGYYRSMPRNWHSSFGQSKLPRSAHRLATATGERRWLEIEQHFFHAFEVPRSVSHPWLVGVDRDCLWLDEYPCGDRLSEVFNGHVYALEELLKYAELTGSTVAENYARAAAWTAWYTRDRFRAAGTASRYALQPAPYSSPSYHSTNVSCMNDLWTMTGREGLAATVDHMLDDWIIDEAGNRFTAYGGLPHTLRDGRNRITTWRPASTVNGTVRKRASWNGRVWLLMSDGPRKGYWLREDSVSSFLDGYDTNAFRFVYPARASLRTGVMVPGYAFSANGRRYQRVARRWAAPSGCSVDRSAVLAGRRCWHVTNGYYAGLWVQSNNLVIH
jgi:hypothetical protein